MDPFAKAPHWAVGRFCGICTGEIIEGQAIYADVEKATDTGLSVKVECKRCRDAVDRERYLAERNAYADALLLLKHNDKSAALDGLTARLEHARIQAARV